MKAQTVPDTRGTQPGHDELKVTAHGWHYAASGAESEGRLTG